MHASAHNLVACVTSDIAWVADLAVFVQAPEGVRALQVSHVRSPRAERISGRFPQAFEDVVPSEATRITLKIDDVSLHAKGPTLPGAIVLAIGSATVSTEITNRTPAKSVQASGQAIRVFALDDLGAPVATKHQGVQAASGDQHWKVRTANGPSPNLVLRLKVTSPAGGLRCNA